MDTSANKELVCMLLQGIANKLPEGECILLHYENEYHCVV